MSTPEQQKQFDDLMDAVFTLDAEHPYLGQMIEPQPEQSDLGARFNRALKQRYAMPYMGQWKEQLHPRGQPENKGQFAPKGGGVAGGAPVKAPQPSGGQRQQGPPPRQPQQRQAAPSPEAQYLMHADRAVTEPPDESGVQYLMHSFEQHPLVRRAEEQLEALRKEHGLSDIVQYTKSLHTDKNGNYTQERQVLHNELISKVLTPATLATEGSRPKMVILLGAPGSGKTSAGTPTIGKLGVNFATLNTDDFRAGLPEYEGWNAPATHAEAADIMKSATMRGMSGRHNLILDVTGTNMEKTLGFVDKASERGYDVHIVHVKTEPRKSVYRAAKRFLDNAFNRQGKGEPGRYVPLGFAYHDVDSRPDVTYVELKRHPAVKSWAQLDNNVPWGSPPGVLDKGEKNG